MSADTASAWPGTVKAASFASGSSGGSGSTGPIVLGQRFGDLLYVGTPRSGAVDAAAAKR